jgi:chemotaxis protein methyltransferase CheR
VNAVSTPSDTTYRELKEHVVASTGLAYYETRDADFRERIDRRLRLLGIASYRTYLKLLHDNVLGQAELDHLITELTIGETFFFRDQNQFNALHHLILPDLLESKPTFCPYAIYRRGSLS